VIDLPHVDLASNSDSFACTIVFTHNVSAYFQGVVTVVIYVIASIGPPKRPSVVVAYSKMEKRNRNSQDRLLFIGSYEFVLLVKVDRLA